ncbi:MAG TPA: YncE family protein [Terriglobales bacterium]|nr:YncE family protein [Terriglobales bacterium]
MRNLLAACVLLLAASLAASAQHYKVTGNIPIAGEGGWDYLYADSPNRTLYVAHDTVVDIVNLDSEKPVGKISGMKHVHGIAVAEGLNRGFISDGGSGEVVVFNLKTHAVLQKVKAGTNPDGILYDPASKRVFAFNGRSQDATAIDAATGKVAGTIALGGKPEFPATDAKGDVYANIEDKSEIVRLDPHTLKIKQRWSIAPCEEPSGLAFDVQSRRLFPVCDNKLMAIVDADGGKVVTTVPIGEGPDAAAYDAARKLAFSSNGHDGTLTVVKQESADKYMVVQTLTTEKSARTMALDSKTHKIYLAAAKLGPPPPPTKEHPHPYPSIVSGTFHLVVVSPQ